MEDAGIGKTGGLVCGLDVLKGFGLGLGLGLGREVRRVNSALRLLITLLYRVFSWIGSLATDVWISRIFWFRFSRMDFK